MSVAIRSARTADLDFIVDCNARLAQETESKQLNAQVLRAGVHSALASEHKGRYFIAELDGRPAGQLLLTHEWSDWRNGFFWWFQSVYVVPEARRHGVFAALYHMSRSWRGTALTSAACASTLSNTITTRNRSISGWGSHVRPTRSWKSSFLALEEVPDACAR